MLGIWKAVPVGLAFNIHPLGIWLTTSAGAAASVLILYFFGKQLREYILKKRQRIKNRKKEARASRLLEKYGVFGLGFIGTLLMGPIMTIVLGLIIVQSHKKLLNFTIIGIFFWTLVLTYLGYGGLSLFRSV